ncbi:branched-chain amino acid ABC transporter substrate-binding protein [Herminiimonas sp. CN]|uniref:branched-chain amino acid ABC transporter substrate-binding protein n=1 Tax=Herminiimonas sp. CN TaxID=1349818 RepID=UPI0004742B47|nr:branched-chain amino acid ABC transporter substrate-binding protein [Herminiimonas sp. CN]
MQFIPKMFPIAGAIALALAGSAYAQEQVVKIGVTGPLSGANAFAGKDNENGVRLAVEELNAKKLTIGGKQIKFELLSEDDQCDPKAGVNVAQKFVDSGVKFVMGPYCSGVAIPASRVYSEAGVMMSTVGTNPKVTQSGYKDLYRIIASDSQVGSSMAVYAANVLKAKTVGVIDDRTAFGQGLAEEFIKVAKKSGLKVLGQEFTTDKATDFNSILTSLKAKKVDVIFFGGYAPQGAPMARQMKQLGMNVKLMGGDTLCSPEMGKLGGDAVGENVLCAQGGTILDKVANGPAFKEKYKKRYNQNPDVYAASFYDQLMFIGEAMQKAKSVDPVKVGDELYKMSYKGVAGTYSYDDKGNMKQSPVTVYTFKNGVPVPLASY